MWTMATVRAFEILGKSYGARRSRPILWKLVHSREKGKPDSHDLGRLRLLLKSLTKPPTVP
jgi:hypothetical protein